MIDVYARHIQCSTCKYRTSAALPGLFRCLRNMKEITRHCNDPKGVCLEDRWVK